MIKASINGVHYQLCGECGVYKKAPVVLNKKGICLECSGDFSFLKTFAEIR